MDKKENSYLAIAINDKKYLESHNILADCKAGYTNQLMTQCQQVTEKLLKHLVYIFCAGDSEAEGLLTKHNLTGLYRKLTEYQVILNIDVGQLRAVKDAFFECRYPGDDYYILSTEETMSAYQLMNNVYSETIRVLCAECVKNREKLNDLPEQAKNDVKELLKKEKEYPVNSIL